MEPRIEALARALVEELPGDGFDLVPGLSIPLPVVVIAEMLGVEPERQPDFRRWSDAFVGLLENPPTPELVGASQELLAYFRDLAEARRREPRDDLVSALLRAEIEGRRLSQEELDGFFVVLLVAGNETTTNLISNQLAILSRRPDLWKRLRQDRARVPAALEETVRFDSPVQNLGRQTTREVEIRGSRIPKQSRVIVSYGAANRDPEAFEAPDTYDLDRGESRHLGFGFGVHFCLGAGLARLEGRLALNALLDRFSEIAPGTAPPERLGSSVIRGFESLPLEAR
jgi:cytochrome P450